MSFLQKTQTRGPCGRQRPVTATSRRLTPDATVAAAALVSRYLVPEGWKYTLSVGTARTVTAGRAGRTQLKIVSSLALQIGGLWRELAELLKVSAAYLPGLTGVRCRKGYSCCGGAVRCREDPTISGSPTRTVCTMLLCCICHNWFLVCKF